VARKTHAAEARKRTLLSELERALLEAISESPEVHQALWRLQREGYVLHLALDCEREDDADAPSRPEPAPQFRIDATDLQFLRSIGIDPTRKRRARRPS